MLENNAMMEQNSEQFKKIIITQTDLALSPPTSEFNLRLKFQKNPKKVIEFIVNALHKSEKIERHFSKSASHLCAKHSKSFGYLYRERYQ